MIFLCCFIFHFVDPSEFTVKDNFSEDMYDMDLKTSLQRARTRPLLKVCNWLSYFASESIIPMAFLAYCFKVLFDWVLWDLLYKSQRPIGSIVEISRSQWELNVNSRNQPREHLSANVQVFGGFVFFGVWRESSRPITERKKKNQSNSNFDTIENWWNRKYLRYNV